MLNNLASKIWLYWFGVLTFDSARVVTPHFRLVHIQTKP